MRRPILPLRRRLWADRGQITAFVVPLMVTLMAMAGLALDGGLALAARVRALGEAQEAARAGAQAIDLAVYRADGTLRLDPAQARRLAVTYLTGAGTQGMVSATEEEVTVTVTAVQDTQLLHLVGVDTLTVTASGAAQPQPGITGPQP
ncbi:hypothetical protein RM780_09850 [Streptomyces sp. DSM 44917]|uniref:Putative Flp pilus-assembly TadG-like N-terminal domain-containing protein n=1 Tax=Streptomyces boetiae TaxID=3075541 RepID=A0ABU2L6S2_9ACTN|nr:pilus assembly protein TadG-related protein [Streptomyces sp. DSM 44917]MDT0307265.1 hypothetical protein [Streptomyces sp. DSM 44917]